MDLIPAGPVRTGAAAAAAARQTPETPAVIDFPAGSVIIVAGKGALGQTGAPFFVEKSMVSGAIPPTPGKAAAASPPPSPAAAAIYLRSQP